MTQITSQAKLKSATEVICRQGMVQFSVSDTAIAIVAAIDRTVPATTTEDGTPMRNVCGGVPDRCHRPY